MRLSSLLAEGSGDSKKRFIGYGAINTKFNNDFIGLNGQGLTGTLVMRETSTAVIKLSPLVGANPLALCSNVWPLC